VTDLTTAYATLSRKRKLIAQCEIKRLEYDKLHAVAEYLRRPSSDTTLTDRSPPPLPTFEQKCEYFWDRVQHAVAGYLGSGGFEPRERQAALEFVARKLTEKVMGRIVFLDGSKHLGFYLGTVAGPEELPRDGNAPGDLRFSRSDQALWLWTGNSSGVFTWIVP